MEGDLFHIAEERDKPRQHPAIQRRMRLAAQIHFHAAKNVRSVRGVQRVHQGVRRHLEIDIVVALDRLVEKRKPQGQHQGQHQEELTAP